MPEHGHLLPECRIAAQLVCKVVEVFGDVIEFRLGFHELWLTEGSPLRRSPDKGCFITGTRRGREINTVCSHHETLRGLQLKPVGGLNIGLGPGLVDANRLTGEDDVPYDLRLFTGVDDQAVRQDGQGGSPLHPRSSTSEI